MNEMSSVSFGSPYNDTRFTKTIISCRLKFKRRKAEDIWGVGTKHVEACGNTKKKHPSLARAAKMIQNLNFLDTFPYESKKKTFWKFWRVDFTLVVLVFQRGLNTTAYLRAAIFSYSRCSDVSLATLFLLILCLFRWLLHNDVSRCITCQTHTHEKVLEFMRTSFLWKHETVSRYNLTRSCTNSATWYRKCYQDTTHTGSDNCKL